jgi:hypothetical protein
MGVRNSMRGSVFAKTCKKLICNEKLSKHNVKIFNFTLITITLASCLSVALPLHYEQEKLSAHAFTSSKDRVEKI